MSHQETYRHNETLAQVLADWDPAFYAKYIDTLKPVEGSGKVLDVGCGVGRVVGELRRAGVDAMGVDVSEANIQRARDQGLPCEFYDGKRLPFSDATFASAGALNVLEHVEEPEDFLKELVRVVRPGGRVVVSSPNFYRAIGLRDYHRQMRGWRNKLANWNRLREKNRMIREVPEQVRFDRMTPVFKEPFEPDDDAIVATNGIEMRFFLERFGCEVTRVECTDRYVPRLADWILNATPLRFLMFNAFVVAHRKEGPVRGS